VVLQLVQLHEEVEPVQAVYAEKDADVQHDNDDEDENGENALVVGSLARHLFVEVGSEGQHDGGLVEGESDVVNALVVGRVDQCVDEVAEYHGQDNVQHPLLTIKIADEDDESAVVDDVVDGVFGIHEHGEDLD
jgi:hypothetical protein